MGCVPTGSAGLCQCFSLLIDQGKILKSTGKASGT